MSVGCARRTLPWFIELIRASPERLTHNNQPSRYTPLRGRNPIWFKWAETESSNWFARQAQDTFKSVKYHHAPMRFPVPPIPSQYILKIFLTVENISALIVYCHPVNARDNRKQDPCPRAQVFNIYTISNSNSAWVSIRRTGKACSVAVTRQLNSNAGYLAD